MLSNQQTTKKKEGIIMLPRKMFFDSMFDDLKFDEKMSCDIYEKDDVFHVEVDIPGFDKNDIKIEFNKGTLSITAEKNEEEADETKKYLCRERKFYGKYQRSFYLGEVDEDNIDAKFANGILSITIPKKPEENTKKMIEIK